MMTKEDYKEEVKKARRKYAHLTIHLFFAVLVLFGVIGLLIPLRPKESTMEKRTLTQFPAPSFRTVVSGEFFEQISLWYADTFPFRESLIGINSHVKSLYGFKGDMIYGEKVVADEIPDADAEIDFDALAAAQGESGQDQTEDAEPTADTDSEGEENLPDATIHEEPEHIGEVFITGNTGFEPYGFTIDGANGYIQMINTVGNMFDGIADVYDVLVPTGIAVCLDREMQEKVGSSSQEDSFAYVYGHVNDNVNTVELIDVMKSHNAEYIYFRTDHHWTADGAYYGYCELMKAMGKEPCPLENYERREIEGFLGSFYTGSMYNEALGSDPDTIVTYTPEVNDLLYYDQYGNEYQGNVIVDDSWFDAANKYCLFIGGDEPLQKIENPNITDGSSIVLVKESFGNCFAPFLVNSFQTVYVVDYRYYAGSLMDLVVRNGVQNVVFLNNAATIVQSRVEQMMSILY